MINKLIYNLIPIYFIHYYFCGTKTYVLYLFYINHRHKFPVFLVSMPWNIHFGIGNCYFSLKYLGLKAKILFHCFLKVFKNIHTQILYYVYTVLGI